MIYYFSATGNCKYVAEKIAAEIGTNAVSIEDCMKDPFDNDGPTARFFLLNDDENYLGIVTPTYSWGLPAKVESFLKTTSFNSAKPYYFFFVTTYGTLSGCTADLAKKYVNASVKDREKKFDAYYSVRMPDTWTPIFDLSDREKVLEKNKKADEEINTIIESIKGHRVGNYCRNRMPSVIEPAARASYENMRKTSHFSVDDTCIGCGLCAKNCPDKAIVMKDGKPSWQLEKCEVCLRCLHHCPKFSIQYGKNTRKHGQYTHEMYC